MTSGAHILFWTAATSLALCACYDVPPPARSQDRAQPAAASPNTPAVDPADDTPPALEDGPVDIRGVTYTPSDRRPAAGAWVFAPLPRNWARWQSGSGDTLGTFALARVRTDGVSVSQIQNADGTTFSVPNALLLPIPRVPTIALGDVVLVPRDNEAVQAVVISLAGGGVTLSDLRENRPVEQRTFETERHLVLPLEARQPGMWILCADREATRMYQLLDDNGENLLVLDSYLAITVRRRDRCAPVEPEPFVRENTEALAWVYGALRRAQVQAVFADEARARVSFSLAGRPQTVDVPLFHVVIGAPEVGVWGDDDEATPVVETER
jgi:hypothetical protein